MTTYKDAGVNISEAGRAVKLFRAKVTATFNVPGATVRTDFGQFSALVEYGDIPGVAFGYSMDGIGTKLMIALELEKFDTVGECLVAHCINDLLTAGIRAKTFTDYVGTAGLKAETAAAIVGSIADACKKFGLILVGGELAEMPGVYCKGQYDMIGSITGNAQSDKIIDASKVQAGDVVYALPSNGPHCNGYSLIRHVFADLNLNEEHYGLGQPLGDILLAPSVCYADTIHRALSNGCNIHAMANITGGGIPGNLSRVLPKGLYAGMYQASVEECMPNIFEHIQILGKTPWRDMVTTFNLGTGFVVVLPSSDDHHNVGILEQASGHTAFKIGTVYKGIGNKIQFNNDWGSF